jgi:hypothetical protein
LTRVEVDPGICGMKAVITAQADGEDRVHLKVESDCPAVRRMFETLTSVDPLTEGRTILRSSAYLVADACLKHPDCIVPAAAVKAVNVEAGLALPKESTIRIAKE